MQGGQRGTFALRRYLSAAYPVPNGTPDLSALRSRTYRFSGSVPDLRLPKDPAALAPLLDTTHAEAAFAALRTPTGCIPLVDEGGCRRAALATAVSSGEGLSLVSVTLTVRPGANRYQQPELRGASVTVAGEREAMIDMLAARWADADPVARSVAGGAPAVWLGTDPRSPGSKLPDEATALGAAYDLSLEVVRDVARRTRELTTRLGENPPEYVVVWTPHAPGVDRLLGAYGRASDEGEIIRLDEPAEADALLELRLHLDELGLAAPVPDAPVAAQRAPSPGEERFYIKSHDSAAGDMMVTVADCGHGQWGSDCRRKAPKAYKGIAAGEGVRPETLFRCRKCTKHRWRARF